MPTTPKKKAAKTYKPKCKRCGHESDKAYPRATAEANLKGKSPISCEACGAKVGHIWIPVAE